MHVVALSVNFPTLGRRSHETGQSMSGSRPKLYLAIGTFYEIDRLRSAVNTLMAWGFSGNGLWELVPRDPGAFRKAEATGIDPGGAFRLQALSIITLPTEKEKQAPREEGADLSHLCLNALTSGNAAAEIRQHLEHGATVLVVGTESSDLHDQCVKVLLRHSRHAVHSQEVINLTSVNL